MDAGNSSFGRGEAQEARDRHSNSSSDDELPRNLVVQQGINSVGEEAASNIVGGRTGPLGSTSTPADSIPADSGDSGSKMSRRRSWVWKHFSIKKRFKDKSGVNIGPRAVCHYCDTNYSSKSNHGVGQHTRHLRTKHEDKIGDASDSNFVYSKEKMRHGLALYVAAAEQPFTFGGDIRFEYFVQNFLNPSFAKVSRNSTRSDTKKAHSEVKKELMSEFASLGAIGFTSDMWQQEFDKLCTSCYNVKPKNMNSDVQTRWNSTYIMLKSCRKYSDAISAFVNQRYRGTPLTPADWKIGFEFMKFLKVFYVATVACSGVRYPTSCIVLNNLYNISLNFLNHREQPNLVSACIDMEGKFRKYYEEMPPIYLLAAVMDPRIKLEGVSLLLSGIGTNLGITTLPSSAFVNDLLTIMYAKYDTKFGPNVTRTAAPLTSPTSSNDASWFLLSSSLGIGSSNVTSRVELSKYLELESVSVNDRINFDILAWWKKNEEKYPVLSIMARDLLTPPVSSVASESAFSAGKRVLDERRSRLAPDILDCLICLKDWEDARLGIEKRSAKDEFRGYFADSDIESD
ncbi:hypothetical protein RHSIM_Rhsim12G0104300 [Rhododendron simsii]|uniref:BED-type domain-containing protein n=1 Tax=Rhododendron simsii TaxID=118357 RepID=A0A834G480_RHOSS|nr:hypothetical protein RHSIM_Rhsim12G0104300 [Rhododendron simsii]